jgi:hypothetical protein
MQDEGLPPFIAMMASAVLIIGVIMAGVVVGAALIWALSGTPPG